MRFLKKHYEKIILCVVLLGLAAAAISMGTKIAEVKDEVNQPTESRAGSKGITPLDLTAEAKALAEAPPRLVLTGEHNLFNPVTWKRKANGDLLKILTNGPDALTITSMTPLYTVIAYERPTGTDAVYVFTVQTHSGKTSIEYPKKDQKTKSGIYIVRGIKGAPDDPSEIQLEILETQEKVWISKNNPYKRVDGYTVDLKYDPEPELNLHKKQMDNIITLDNEKYKIIDITTNGVRVQSINNTKVTTIKWNGNP